MTKKPNAQNPKESWLSKTWNFVIANRAKMWYVILLSVSTIFVWRHRTGIGDLSSLNSASLIFLFWTILLIYPLFSEMEVLGVKLKKEVEKVKEEVKKTTEGLQKQITEIQLSTAVTTNINLQYPVTKAELSVLNKSITQNNLRSPLNEIENVPNNAILLFKARYQIETNLAALCLKYGYNGRKVLCLCFVFLYLAKCLDER